MKRKIFYQTNQNLTTTEEYIIDFIESDPNFFKSSTIVALSKRSNSSISSISKLSKKLGYKSFKEMQIWFNNELLEIERNVIIKSPSSIEDISANIKNKHIMVLSRTHKDLNFANLKKIQNIIKNKYVLTFGIGSSYISALELSDGFDKIGINAKSFTDVHSIFLDINQFNKDTKVIIIFTNSARGKEIEVIRTISQKMAIKVCLFTSRHNLIAHKNETIITYRTIEQEKRIVASSSKISQLFIVDILINWIGQYKKNDIYEEFSKIWR